jgi:hypothetical protein
MPRLMSGTHQRSIACTALRRWWLALYRLFAAHCLTKYAVYVDAVAGATIGWVWAPPSDQEEKL